MPEPWTPKKRLLTAICRRQPDHVPIKVWGVPAWDDGWVASRHPSYGPLIEAVREKCDMVATWGIPTDLFTAVFVIARMSGWTAHAMEQYADNRLIRPRADYTGPVDLSYTPIDKR